MSTLTTVIIARRRLLGRCALIDENNDSLKTCFPGSCKNATLPQQFFFYTLKCLYDELGQEHLQKLLKAQNSVLQINFFKSSQQYCVF